MKYNVFENELGRLKLSKLEQKLLLCLLDNGVHNIKDVCLVLYGSYDKCIKNDFNTMFCRFINKTNLNIRKTKGENGLLRLMTNIKLINERKIDSYSNMDLFEIYCQDYFPDKISLKITERYMNNNPDDFRKYILRLFMDNSNSANITRHSLYDKAKVINQTISDLKILKLNNIISKDIKNSLDYVIILLSNITEDKSLEENINNKECEENEYEEEII